MSCTPKRRVIKKTDFKNKDKMYQHRTYVVKIKLYSSYKVIIFVNHVYCNFRTYYNVYETNNK